MHRSTSECGIGRRRNPTSNLSGGCEHFERDYPYNLPNIPQRRCLMRFPRYEFPRDSAGVDISLRYTRTCCRFPLQQPLSEMAGFAGGRLHEACVRAHEGASACDRACVRARASVQCPLPVAESRPFDTPRRCTPTFAHPRICVHPAGRATAGTSRDACGTSASIPVSILCPRRRAFLCF